MNNTPIPENDMSVAQLFGAVKHCQKKLDTEIIIGRKLDVIKEIIPSYLEIIQDKSKTLNIDHKGLTKFFYYETILDALQYLILTNNKIVKICEQIKKSAAYKIIQQDHSIDFDSIDLHKNSIIMKMLRKEKEHQHWIKYSLLMTDEKKERLQTSFDFMMKDNKDYKGYFYPIFTFQEMSNLLEEIKEPIIFSAKEIKIWITRLINFNNFKTFVLFYTVFKQRQSREKNG